MKGYKGFNKDLKCGDFQYEIGKTYKADGKIALCANGFHFCKSPSEIELYYGNLGDCRYCEIEASGDIIEGDGKCVCSKIKIIREIPLQEFLSLVNEGSSNIGWGNNGFYNNGNHNDGSYNDGFRNIGNSNKGYSNEGNSNKGYPNKGSNNYGAFNCGNENVGAFNRGNGLCGVFNTDCGCVIFNKYTEMKFSVINSMKGYYLLGECIQDKKSPSDKQLEEIKKLPNFDKKIMNELIFGKGEKK